MMNITFLLAFLVLSVLNYEVTSMNVRGLTADHNSDYELEIATTAHHAHKRALMERKNMDDDDDDEDEDGGNEDRQDGESGNCVTEYYTCVPPEDLMAAGKDFLFPQGKNEPEENMERNINGERLTANDCDCPDGCCRMYNFMLCDVNNDMPWLQCICNRNTCNRPTPPTVNVQASSTTTTTTSVAAPATTVTTTVNTVTTPATTVTTPATTVTTPVTTATTPMTTVTAPETTVTTPVVNNGFDFPSPNDVNINIDRGLSSSCSDHAQCAASGLNGVCCPTLSGEMLFCCTEVSSVTDRTTGAVHDGAVLEDLEDLP